LVLAAPLRRLEYSPAKISHDFVLKYAMNTERVIGKVHGGDVVITKKFIHGGLL
jgi:hypothetical protein